VYEVLLQLICDHHSTAKLLPSHVSVQDNMAVAAGLININPNITLTMSFMSHRKQNGLYVEQLLQPDIFITHIRLHF
jgi:hypothetical protein